MFRLVVVVWLALAGCKHPGAAGVDGSTGDAAGSVDAAPTALALSCAATTATFSPAPCPPPGAGGASFCFRPQWPGVTSVEVYGGFGMASDWTAPLTTLTADAGTFTATVALGDGSYPYLFRVHGSADNLVKDGQYLLDQGNPQFVPSPAGAPIQRSVSQLTVPQTAAPLHHVHGQVVDNGSPQPCFSVGLEVGELLDAQNHVLSEHYTANFTESAPDGTFDFPVADGQVMAIVRYPFLLASATAPYPDPSLTPSIGYARTTATIAADLALDPVEVAYPDYAAMTPSGSATLPVTFAYTVVPASSAASVAVIGTNIAGNDPAYRSADGTATSLVWDGTFLDGMHVIAGTPYFWGTWQQRGATWVEESLLFPITFH